MRISDWSSDVCSSDLQGREPKLAAEACPEPVEGPLPQGPSATMGTPQSPPPPGLDALNDSPFPLDPTAPDAQQAIKEETGFFGDWYARYQDLLDLGRTLPDLPVLWKMKPHRRSRERSVGTEWVSPSIIRWPKLPIQN